MQGKTDLLEVGNTRNLPGPLLRLGQRRQQHGRQDGDNGYDHEQLDQGEPRRTGRFRMAAQAGTHGHLDIRLCIFIFNFAAQTLEPAGWHVARTTRRSQAPGLIQ